MTLSSSRLAFLDCYDALDRALEDDRGARIKVETQDHGIFFRMRLNVARRIDRTHNRDIYPEDNPLHGTSLYDQLIFRAPREIDGQWWVYIEHNKLMPGQVEVLSEVEELGTQGGPSILMAHGILPRPIKRRV